MRCVESGCWRVLHTRLTGVHAPPPRSGPRAGSGGASAKPLQNVFFHHRRPSEDRNSSLHTASLGGVFAPAGQPHFATGLRSESSSPLATAPSGLARPSCQSMPCVPGRAGTLLDSPRRACPQRGQRTPPATRSRRPLPPPARTRPARPPPGSTHPRGATLRARRSLAVPPFHPKNGPSTTVAPLRPPTPGFRVGLAAAAVAHGWLTASERARGGGLQGRGAVRKRGRDLKACGDSALAPGAAPPPGAGAPRAARARLSAICGVGGQPGAARGPAPPRP
jgi:hypothetical protein